MHLYNSKNLEEIGEEIGENLKKNCSKKKMFISLGIISTTFGLFYYFF